MKAFSRKLFINLVFSSIFVFVLGVGSAMAATYTVDTLVDADDGSCIDGDVTLREAIGCAEANAGQDTIAFGVGGTITFTANGPSLAPTDSTGVILNCAGGITFDGDTGSFKGIHTSSNSTIKGCTFTNMLEASIYVDGDGNTIGATGASDRNVIRDMGIDVAGSNNTFNNNYVGILADGVTADGGSEGITIQSGTNNTIGGDTGISPSNANLIGGASNCGIVIRSGVGTLDIYGNYIGLNKNGNAAVGNFTGGICFDSGATFGSAINIGSTSSSGLRNFIAGNVMDGILVRGTFTSTLNIKGNFIGTAKTGTAAVANGDDGIDIASATCSSVGNCLIASNLISGNTANGVNINSSSSNFTIGSANYIGVDKNGTSALANGAVGVVIDSSTGNVIGSTDGTFDAPNVISGNTSHGIYITGGSSNTIAENRIGLNNSSAAVIANGGDGVLLNATGTVTMGFSAGSTLSNHISGNTGDGIEVAGNSGAIGIYSSAIGVMVSTDFGNGEDGIEISGSPSALVTIGNGTTGRNNISGNVGYGINVGGGDNHVIKGNVIGLNKDADAAVANDAGGINVVGGSALTIGSTVTNEGNMIAGHAGGTYDVTIGSGVTGAMIYGNYIGMNSSGTTIQSSNGIYDAGTSTLIGSATDSGRNYIGGHNGSSGSVRFYGATGSTMVNNWIGVKPDGSASTTSTGIMIENDSSTITIGGTTSAERNIVGGSTVHGIYIDGASTIVIMGNFIGVGSDGATDRGNTNDGIHINPGLGNTATDIYIGRNAAGSSYFGNVISGNGEDGIDTDGAGTVGNVYIEANVIGLNKDKDTAVANAGNGLNLKKGTLMVRGVDSGKANVIAGNTGQGITLNLITGATIIGNYIGTNASFADFANGGAGIGIGPNTDGNVIGYAVGETIDSGLTKANKLGYNGNGGDNDITVAGENNSLRGNIFSVASGDSSPNIVFNAHELSITGTAFGGTVNTTKIGGTTDIVDGSKVDIYAYNDGTYTTTYLGTAVVAGGTFVINGDFTANAGETAYFQVTNASGHSTKLGGSSVIATDSTAPTAPVVTSGDTTPTATASVTLQGTKEAYSSIIKDGSTTIVPLDSSTSWSYPVVWVEGSNSFVLTSKDYAGNESSSKTVTVILDTAVPSAPTVTSGTAFSGSGYTYSATITGTKEAGALIKNNVTQVVAANGSTTWEYSVTIGTGTTNFSFTQVDGAGNTSTAKAHSVTYTQINPQVYGGGGGGGSAGGTTAGTTAGTTTSSADATPPAGSTSNAGEIESTTVVGTGSVSGEVDTSLMSTDKSKLIPVKPAIIKPATAISELENVEEKYPLFEASAEDSNDTTKVEDEKNKALLNPMVPVELQARKEEKFSTQIQVATETAKSQPELEESVRLIQNYVSPVVSSVVEEGGVAGDKIDMTPVSSSSKKTQVIPQTRLSLMTTNVVAQAYQQNTEDKDGDRLPDWWEKKYFGNVTSVDGMTLTVQGLNMKTAFVFGLDPKAIDTDGDGESDVDEIAKGHDASVSNTGKGDLTIEEDDDGNGIPNWVERAAGTSTPKIEAGVPVEWAEKNGLDVKEYSKPQTIKGIDKKLQIPFSMKDTDGDGLTDLNEAKYCTNPKMVDTDGDGLSDYDEIFVFASNPASCGEVVEGGSTQQELTWADSERIYVPRFFNIDQEENKFGDDPLLAGVLKPNQHGELLIIPNKDLNLTSWIPNLFASLFGVDSGVETVKVRADSNGKFLSKPSLDSGDYTIVVRALDKNGEIENEAVPYSINVDDTLRSDWVKPEQLDAMPIDLNSLELITLENSRPYLYGKVTQRNLEVRTNWASQLYTSSLVVDTDEGEFVTLAPSALEDGSHALDVYAFDPSNNLYSSTVHLDFNVLTALFNSAMDTKKSGTPWALLLVGMGGLVSLGVFGMVRRRRSHEVTPPSNPMTEI